MDLGICSMTSPLGRRICAFCEFALWLISSKLPRGQFEEKSCTSLPHCLDRAGFVIVYILILSCTILCFGRNIGQGSEWLTQYLELACLQIGLIGSTDEQSARGDRTDQK